MIEVGDLVWDNMASDIGIVVGLDHDRCVYTVWWDENSLLGRADTTGEAFTNFKESWRSYLRSNERRSWRYH